jgi:hypothetical protein
MLKIVRLALQFVAALIAWLYLLHAPNLNPALASLVPLLPLYALVSFGLYSIGVVGYR